VLRTFSKIFGLAGLRLGYVLADPELVRYLHSVQEPFNVNRAALAAGMASLGRAGELAARRDLAVRARERLARRLAVGGMAPVPSSANFVLVELGRRSAPSGTRRKNSRGRAITCFART
jgi:histidinol-phosphate aminotransferase